ncbi:MAG: hypothetical protein HYZ53_15665 [Planctomycetes bacterium]|nr:hypothetical protein [Planctomycetota bacterium]
MTSSGAPARAAAPITLRELFSVIAITAVILALLAKGPFLGGHGGGRESYAQAMLRDLESAIKAYESDYARFPPSNPAGDEADNRALVASLSLRGRRGSPYYSFRAELLRGPMPPHLERARELAEIPGGYAAFPELVSPIGEAEGSGGQGDRLLRNIFYRAPGVAFNTGTFELWTGHARPNDVEHHPSPLPAAAPRVPSEPSDRDRLGGVNAGRYFSRINNWR